MTGGDDDGGGEASNELVGACCQKRGARTTADKERRDLSILLQMTYKRLYNTASRFTIR